MREINVRKSLGESIAWSFLFRDCIDDAASDGFQERRSLFESFNRWIFVFYSARCNDEVFPGGANVTLELNTDTGIVSGTGVEFVSEQIVAPVAITTFAANQIGATGIGVGVVAGNYIDIVGSTSNDGRVRVTNVVDDDTVDTFETLVVEAAAGTAEAKRLGEVSLRIDDDDVKTLLGCDSFIVDVWDYDLADDASKRASYGLEITG